MVCRCLLQPERSHQTRNPQQFQMMFARCPLKVDLIDTPSTSEVLLRVKGEPAEILHSLSYGLDHHRLRGLLISLALRRRTVHGNGIEVLQSLQASRLRRA